MLRLVDYSYDVPPSFQEGKGIIGGFNMRCVCLCLHNTHSVT